MKVRDIPGIETLVAEVENRLYEGNMTLGYLNRYDICNIANANNIPLHINQATAIMEVIQDLLAEKRSKR